MGSQRLINEGDKSLAGGEGQLLRGHLWRCGLGLQGAGNPGAGAQSDALLSLMRFSPTDQLAEQLPMSVAPLAGCWSLPHMPLVVSDGCWPSENDVPLRGARAAVVRMVLATICFGLLFACILPQHLDAFQCDWSRCAARTSGTRRRRRSGAPTRAATSNPAPSTPSNLRATTSDSKSCSGTRVSQRNTCWLLHVGVVERERSATRSCATGYCSWRSISQEFDGGHPYVGLASNLIKNRGSSSTCAHKSLFAG